MTAASSIAQANRLGGFDFYLALHSNAAAPANAGNVRGVLVFYYPTSAEGKRAADLFAANLKRVYPLPDLVRTVPTTALGEVRQPKYPANLLELGYHDNYADAAWVENNMDAIARELARSLTEYFGLPFIEPQPVVQGKPCVARLTPRAFSTNSFCLTLVYKKVTIFGGFMEGREGALPFVDSKTRFDIPSGHGRTGRSDGSKSGHRRNQMNIPSLVIGLAAGLFIGILACILYRNKKAKDDKEKIANAEEEALRIINDAIKSAESKKREAARPTRSRRRKRPLPRSTPLWTRRTKKSRSSSAARPRCSSASPALRLTRPRST